MQILIYETSQHCKDKFALKEAFEALGHQTDVFDWQRYLYTYSRSNLIERVKERFLFKLTADRINTALLKEIKGKKYDLLIVVRGDHISPETLSFAKANIGLVVNWNSDDVFNKLNSTQYMLDCFGLYDCIFSPRGHLKAEYLSRGAKLFEPISWYYRPGLLYSPDQIAQRECEDVIAFVGAWSKRREQTLGPLNGLPVQIWGWGWNKRAHRSFTSGAECKPQINMEDMMEVFVSSKINVNILTLENRDTTNFRNFEIPAAGGFQLSERSDEILQLFDEDKEIVCFGSADELKSKCAYYLKNETERRRIASNGYDRLIGSNNSIIDRAKQILSTFS